MKTTRDGGILNLHKPPGLTSHDLVAHARRVTGERRVGHAGTLDPFAEGVLLVGYGPGTKILPYLSALPKEYEGTLLLGEATDTMDTEGRVVERLPVPPLGPAAIGAAMARFRGRQQQQPPAYSAVKIGGVRAYRLAREGLEVSLSPRQVDVERLELISWEPPLLRFRARVSKGTYLRRLAADLAGALGTCGHLVALVRTAVGPHALESSLTPERLREEAAAGRLADSALSLAEALAHLPRVVLDAEGERLLCHGRHPRGHFTLPEPLAPGATAAAVGPGGRLVALVRGLEARAGEPRLDFVIERVIAAG